jgi:LysM repeat protein
MSITAAALPAHQRYSVVVPARLAAPRPAQPTSSAQQTTSVIYIRRRLLVSLVIAAVVAVVWLGAGSVVANRGGDPASASAVRPTATVTYVVQPGDSMWSIAASHRGGHSQVDYVDMLIEVNGGSSLEAGQQLVLP